MQVFTAVSIKSDTEEFLKQLDYSDQEISDFRLKGAVVCNSDLTAERLREKSKSVRAR